MTLEPRRWASNPPLGTPMELWPYDTGGRSKLSVRGAVAVVNVIIVIVVVGAVVVVVERMW